MIRKLTLLVGFGAGYVLGAKAGTERYDQIMGKVRELAGQPAVQDLTTTVTQTATTMADTAKSKANETVEKVNSTVTAAAGSSTASTGTPDVVDLSASTSRTGAETGAAPMAGAAASDTV